MSESSESLCKLISNIPRINWAIKRRYMLSPWFYLLVPCSCVCMCALVCKTCNYSVLTYYYFFCKEQQLFFASGLLRKQAVNVKHTEVKKQKKQTNKCKVNSNGNTALCNLFIMKKVCVRGGEARSKEEKKQQQHLRCVQKVGTQLLKPKNFLRRC